MFIKLGEVHMACRCEERKLLWF